jgi:hypothetical protein
MRGKRGACSAQCLAYPSHPFILRFDYRLRENPKAQLGAALE